MVGNGMSNNSPGILARGWVQDSNGDIIFLAVDDENLKMVRVNTHFQYIASRDIPLNQCATGAVYTCVTSASAAITHWDNSIDNEYTDERYGISSNSAACKYLYPGSEDTLPLSPFLPSILL